MIKVLVLNEVSRNQLWTMDLEAIVVDIIKRHLMGTYFTLGQRTHSLNQFSVFVLVLEKLNISKHFLPFELESAHRLF